MKRSDRGATELQSVLAVDGGDSKTDVAIVDTSGVVLAAARWAQSSHLGLDHDSGEEALTAAVTNVVRRLRGEAGRDQEVPEKAVATVGVYCMAGVDFPIDERRVERFLHQQGWTERVIVRNDTFAVLRAGSTRGWGIGVVCGAGLNCVAVGPDGRKFRFASLGALSGDLAAGGGWLGVAAVGAAVRAADGRGPRTALEQAIAEHFRARRATAVMERIYTGAIPESRTLELAPLVFGAAAGGDEVARLLIDQLGDEIVAMVTAGARRIRVAKKEVEVVLGGGVFRTKNRSFFDRITAGIEAEVPKAIVRRLDVAPVVGAALIGLDELVASSEAKQAARSSLTNERLAPVAPAREGEPATTGGQGP